MGELWQKKLLVAGFEKTFEIGRQFRNEGMSPEHLQDYTQMEFYWAYADFKIGIDEEWIIYDFETVIEEKMDIDIFNTSKEDNRKVAQMQIILASSEMGNGYTELNNPIYLEERFKEQRTMGDAGDEEAHEHNETCIWFWRVREIFLSHDGQTD